MNIPEYAKEKKYVVMRSVDGELYFWGAWDERERANEVANEINGVVISND